MIDSIQLRLVEPADLETAATWAEAHGAPFVPALLPRLGVVAMREGEAVAMCWLHMDNSVGVCWPECAIARPRLDVKASRRAFSVILGFLEDEARRLDYGAMICHTNPAIARILQGLGFKKDSQCIKLTKLLR